MSAVRQLRVWEDLDSDCLSSSPCAAPRSVSTGFRYCGRVRGRRQGCHPPRHLTPPARGPQRVEMEPGTPRERSSGGLSGKRLLSSSSARRGGSRRGPGTGTEAELRLRAGLLRPRDTGLGTQAQPPRRSTCVPSQADSN